MEEHEGHSRAASALEIQKRSSEESFNVERFKDRLFNLSQASGKEQPPTQNPTISNSPSVAGGGPMPSDRQSPSQMNIVIKAITDIDESSSVAAVDTAGKSMGSLHHDDSKDSLYDQIKKKYMQQ